MKTEKINKQSGFTLAEILVTIALLPVILITVTTILAKTIQVGKQVIDYQKLADELRNVAFAMGKDINEGNGTLTNPSDINSGCASGICSSLEIADFAGKKIKYSLGNSQIKRWLDKNSNEQVDAQEEIILTSNNIETLDLKFYVKKDVNPANGQPLEQPRITIYMKAKPVGGQKIIETQTTISEKNY